MRLARGVLLLAAVALATPARADVFHLFGYGPRAASMGGAMTAEASDYTAVFYNPALLVERQDVNFGFQFQYYRLVPSVTSNDLARPLTAETCPKCQAPDAVGTSLGLAVPLGGKVKNHVAIGFGLYVPAGKLLRLQAADPSAPMWYRFDSDTERLVLHVGLGIKIVDWFKLGLGVQALANLIGSGATVKVDVFSKEVDTRQIDAWLETRVAPVVGLHVSPLKRLRFGLNYRYEMMLKYSIPASVGLDGVGDLSFTVDGVAHYTPHTISFGAAFDATEQLTFSLDGEVQLWSLAPSPYLSINVDLAGPTLQALGLGSALDLESRPGKPGFTDTFGGRLGAEYRLSERFAARAGAFYRPTPVPLQNVPGTNLLDNSTIGAAVGIGFNFPDPLEIFAAPIKIDVAAQAQFLLPRVATKEATDALPSYTYSANLFGVTAAIRYDF